MAMLKKVRRARRESTESAEHFRETVNFAPLGIAHIDPERRILFANPRMEQILGYGESELTGRRIQEFVVPEDQESIEELLALRAQLHAGRIDSISKEHRYRRKDGSPVWVRLNIAAMRDARGKVAYDILAVEDITERKRSEQLRNLEHSVARQLAEASDAPAALKALLRAVCEIGNWECGRYFSVDEEAGALRLAEFWSEPIEAIERFIEGSRNIVFGRGKGLPGEAWKLRKALWVADLARDERALGAGFALEAGIHGSLVFPVIFEGVVIGIFAFNSREIREPDDRLLEALGAIGSQIGQFLQRKRAEEKTQTHALRQRLLAEFGQLVLVSRSLEDVLQHTVELVSETLKVDFCEILQMESEGRQLRFKAVAGWPREWVGNRIVAVTPGSHAEHVLSLKEPVVIEDYRTETRFSRSALLEFGVSSGMQVPIVALGGAFGILGVNMLQARRFGDDDVSFLRRVANILAVAIERKITEERLTHLAEFDSLTGLPNRALIRDRLAQAIAQAKRARRSLAVLFIDLDRFKQINDTLGHAAGDKLLKETALRLTQCVRGGDTVGRFGGDEFGAILLDLAKPADASLVAEKIIHALAQPFNLGGHESFVSASVGITVYPTDGHNSESLIMNADRAMYRAKEQGRDRYQYFTQEMNKRALQRARTERLLRAAIKEQQFLLYYQPRVELASRSISGFEALLRWKHPEKGIISPTEFISVLEDTGLIVPVGEWVLRQACAQLRNWVEAGLKTLPIAVNLSARQFLQKDLEAMVRGILRDTGTEPSLIQFELTETLLMKDPEEAARVLRSLKKLGVKLSMDDFGTGYSSLSYLKRYPLDALKIDRTFIRDITSDADDAAITLAMIGIAHSLNLEVVAEGVETEEQLNFLSNHACDEIQGYYFSPPEPASEAQVMLREGRRFPSPGTNCRGQGDEAVRR